MLRLTGDCETDKKQAIELYQEIIKQVYAIGGNSAYERFTDDFGPYPDSAAELCCKLGLFPRNTYCILVQALEFCRKFVNKDGTLIRKSFFKETV
jgi:DUF1680 family protein